LGGWRLQSGAFIQGENSRAGVLLEEGLTLHREAGDTRGIVIALFFRVRVLLAQGEMARARACNEERLASCAK
jgi:hypothetical protein